MIKQFRRLAAAAALMLTGAFAMTAHEAAIADFLNRIGGPGAADRFVTELTPRADSAPETFTISSEGELPKITGNSLSAITTGIGWYLNHHADINLAWNRLTTDLAAASLPVPAAEETHKCRADYRYYLNYCTFSYSMSTYTWERWQQEIDWMALHGINMPLQIVGLETVWRDLLMEDYGYTREEANDFVGGPCFMAWFGMNNLEGWGGPNPDWWYERQASLGKKINARMRELGIEPVLPGFAGMVPSNFTAKTGIAAQSQGRWCGFQRPYILNPATDDYASVAARYYARLHDVMGGPSLYYSMDPFHEGGNTSGIDVPAGYNAVYRAMEAANPGVSKWVAQQWQFSGAQWQLVGDGVVPRGRLVMLDLFSDGQPGNLGRYNGHDAVWCALPNFGARTGFFGRFNSMISGYFDAVSKHGNIKGIGATPEGTEQTPVIYDILFELPWLDSKPVARRWMSKYADRRYGQHNEAARAAWELLRTSALDCTTALQGPHEATVCARPSLTVDRVSTWGGADIFYDPMKMYQAADLLLNAGIADDNENYSYDLTDITRQALTDYSRSLLAAVKEATDAGDVRLRNSRRDAFLQLILDLDELLNTNPSFMIGSWTELARDIANEHPATTDADRQWLEHANARTLIATWGPRNSADGAGLRDYSYRQKGGMLRDYYHARWKEWFDRGMTAPEGGWFDWEWNWAHNADIRYPTAAQGTTREVASRIFPRYLAAFTPKADPSGRILVPLKVTSDLRSTVIDSAPAGTSYNPASSLALPDGVKANRIEIDLDGDGEFADSERVAAPTFPIAATAEPGRRLARVRLTDGTLLTLSLDVAHPSTAITDATADSRAAADEVYDLAGRRVERPTASGIYIIGGEKTLVRP